MRPNQYYKILGIEGGKGNKTKNIEIVIGLI